MCRSGPQHPSAIRHLGELRLFWAVRDVDALLAGPQRAQDDLAEVLRAVRDHARPRLLTGLVAAAAELGCRDRRQQERHGDAVRLELSAGDRREHVDGGLGGGVRADAGQRHPGRVVPELMLTIRPERRARIAGSTAWVMATRLITLSWSTRANSSRSSRSRGECRLTPALLTSPSIRPCRSSVASASRRTAVGSVTSVGTASAPSSSSLNTARRSARRAARTGCAPAWWSRRAVAAPMPDEAPVTMTVLPVTSRTSMPHAGRRVGSAQHGPVVVAGRCLTACSPTVWRQARRHRDLPSLA